MAIPRPTARILLTDAADRLFLFRFRDYDGSHYWLTPGGGLRRGETVERAAVRELFEEVGCHARAEELGPVVAISTSQWSLGDKVFDAHDSYFHLRVTDTAVDTSRHEKLERSLILGHRWWTADELAATDERVVPAGLASLVRSLLADGPPVSPVMMT